MTIFSCLSRKMRRFFCGGWFTPALVALLAFTAMAFSRASTPEPDFSGHYELADAKANRLFTLDVKQIKRRAEVSFSAAMSDGSDAAPEGSGKGKVEDGVLAFKFKDSFNNEGTCTLQPARKGYELVMTVTKAVEPRPFHFYGNVLLKKITP